MTEEEKMEKLYLIVERSTTTDDVLFRSFVLTHERTLTVELNPSTYSKIVPIVNFTIKKILESKKVHVEFLDDRTDRKVLAIAERV